MLLKCCTQYTCKLETQQWPLEWKRSVFIPIPKKGNAKECSKYRTVAFISHTSKVMYQVTTSVFNQAVKRNANRFPEGFRFQLSKEENDVLISQIVTSKRNAGHETRGGYHKLPYAFTEQGIAMLSASKESLRIIKQNYLCVPFNSAIPFLGIYPE